MPHVFQRSLAAFAFACTVLLPAWSHAQAPEAPGPVRRLTVEEAVRLALEQNLGIRVDRIAPQIQDVSVAQARTYWIPQGTTGITNVSQNTPVTNALAGGQTQVTDSRLSTQFGINQLLPTGTNYSVVWNNARLTSTNLFNNWNPLLNSGLELRLTQPLLRNFKIDNYRQQLEAARKDREIADVQLQSTIAATTRNVKNAYWDLAYQIDNLRAQRQSLDLAKRLLADNEKRVQIGTMAPIDIVEAQSEVARNEEAVIVAEAGIKQAEDRLRALIFDPSAPDFWTTTLEPAESMPFLAQAIDVDAAVRNAIANRTDVQIAKDNLEKTDIDIRYFRNQSLPDVNANVNYLSNAAGGTLLTPSPIFGGPEERSVVRQRGFGGVLGDVLSSQFPTWTVGLSVSYPIGTSTAETNLARARLQRTQAETQLKNLELQISTQVRDAARQVQTNQKRVDTSGVARVLAERRLEAEEKKFAAGIQISFFVFQAQRDLAQARTNEIRAIADYNKSLVDFEAIQQTALR